jgi:hypothetical protein
MRCRALLSNPAIPQGRIAGDTDQKGPVARLPTGRTGQLPPLLGPPSLSLSGTLPDKQRKRRGHRLPPPELVAASRAAPLVCLPMIAFIDCVDELFSIFFEIESCAALFI